jgi:transcriptional regulator with XRE-family HTH domain
MQNKPTPRASRDRSRAPQLRALGRAVRESRKQQKISQEELGFRSGSMHRNYVGAVERGEMNPTFMVLVRLMVGLRMKFSDFIVIYERHMEEYA